MMEGWTFSLHSLETNITCSYYTMRGWISKAKENLSIYLRPSHGPCSHGSDEGHMRVMPL